MLKIYKDATPELIENKRLEILEFRNRKEKIRLEKELLSKKYEEIKKEKEINGIVKVCKFHGNLVMEDCYLSKNGKKSISKIYICKACKNVKGTIYYNNNIDKIRMRQKIYTKNNKEVVRERCKKWVERLADPYVVRFFTKDTKLKSGDVPQELISVKKELIKLKRIIREINDDKNPKH